ncbi:MAG TPA: formyltetrahydrofolate deformylase [Propionibacteriaceae bacterium]|nr:formyltetrahydrofolate deformylase [Propionibacteriaceae bacterium]
MWVLTIACPDRPGIVHAVSGGIVTAGGNIVEAHQFSSLDTGRFFQRIQIETAESDREVIAGVLAPVLGQLRADWKLVPRDRPTRTLVLASKAEHVVSDLLYRRRSGYLNIDVPLVLANHPDLEPVARFYGVDFEHHPVTPDTKPAFEQRVRDLVRDLDIELVVLARYMQILSPELCSDLAGRVINIHHSFLPGFKGANPYRQAHARGVKLIGATAHFVTPDLDEGPIIEQNVVRVDHTKTPQQLMAIGQDQESSTLREAVRLFAEHRVFLDGTRTVIF